MPEGSNARYGGKRLLEQLQPLGGKLRAKERHSGNVPTRPSEAGHEPISDWVAHDRHHDGDSGGRLLCSAGRGGIAGDNEVEIEIDELLRQLCESLDLSIRSPVFDDDVLPLHIAAFPQSLLKSVDHRPLLGRAEGTRHHEPMRGIFGVGSALAALEHVAAPPKLAPPCMSRKEHCEG